MRVALAVLTVLGGLMLAETKPAAATVNAGPWDVTVNWWEAVGPNGYRQLWVQSRVSIDSDDYASWVDDRYKVCVQYSWSRNPTGTSQHPQKKSGWAGAPVSGVVGLDTLPLTAQTVSVTPNFQMQKAWVQTAGGVCAADSESAGLNIRSQPAGTKLVPGPNITNVPSGSPATPLPSGTYPDLIALQETRGSGSKSSKHGNKAQGCHGQPINSATGNFWHTWTDFSIPGRGVPLLLERTYNSSAAAETNGPLGYGWTHSYNMSLAIGTSTVTVNEENGAAVAFTQNGTGYTAPPRVQATLVKNADDTYTFTRAKKTIYSFDATGRLTGIKDLNGYVTSVTYPSADSMVVTDPAGRTLTFTLASGRVTQVSDSASPTRTVTFVYDAAGDLTEATDVNGAKTTFTYDAAHRMLTMRDPRPAGAATPAVTNHYDASGRVDWQSDELDRTTSFDYTSIPGSTKITDPAGNVTVEKYDRGVRTEITCGYGTASAATTRLGYDEATLGITSVIDRAGKTTTMTYDARGNLLSSTDPLNRTTTLTYNDLDDVTSVTDPAGTTTTLSYDAAGNPLGSSTPLLQANPVVNKTATYHYDDTAHPGDVTKVTDALGKNWSFAYDSYGNVASSTDPLGNTATATFDTVGRLLAEVAPKGNLAGADPAAFRTSYEHDAAGRVTRATDPLGAVSTWSYDPIGNLVTETDANNNATTYTYDAADQLTRVTRGDGTALAYGYDANGNRTTSTDAGNHTTTYAYGDPALPHSVTAVTDPLGRITRYGYDRAGRPITKQDPGGDCPAGTGCTTNAFDAAGQLLSITYSDGTTPNVSGLTYDANGRRTAMTDGTGTSHWTWDSLGRLSSATNGGGHTVGYGYDLRGSLTSLTYPGTVGTVTRAYDDAGRMTGVTDWLGNATTFDYDANGNLTNQSFPNATTSTFTPDAADRISSISHAPTANLVAPFAKFTYTRDALGQVASVTSTGVPADDHSYTYSALNQLEGVDAATYDYDAADNLTRTINGNQQSFDAANQLTESRPAEVAPPPAISLVGTAQGGDGGATSQTTLSLPAGVEADDQILVASTTKATNATPTVAGFTQVGTYQAGTGSTDSKTVLFRRTAAAGDSQVALDYGSGFAKTVVAVVYRGVDPAAPIDAVGSGTALNANAVTVPGLTTTKADDRLVLFTGTYLTSVAATWSAPTGMTKVVENATSARTSAIAHQGLGAPGDSGSRTAQLSASATGSLVGVAVALAPTPAPAVPVTTFGYDSRGNRTSVTSPSGATTTLAYDQVNRLTAYGTAATYSYNGDGLRMAKTVDGVTQTFAWDESGSLPLALMDSATAYVYGPRGSPISQIATTPPPVPPAISLVGATQGGDGGAERQLSLTLPQGVQSNDQILVASTSRATQPTPTVAGYTQVGTYQTGATSADSKTVLFRRTAAAGDTQVSLNYGEEFAKTVVVAVYRGVDPAAPIEATSWGTASNASSVTVPSLTTTKGDDRLVLFTASHLLAEPATFSAPEGMTKVVEIAASTRTSSIADQPLGAPGATGSRTSALSDAKTGNLVGVLVTLAKPPTPGPEVLYFHRDQLGSTRVITNTSGAVVGTYTYDPYGKMTASTGSAVTPFGFAGEYTDRESGLQYLRARYYDPSTAQFLTRDPLEPVTATPYAYVGGDPLNATDPSGLIKDRCLGSWCLSDFRGAGGDALTGAGNFAVGFTNAAAGTSFCGWNGEGQAWSRNIGSATFHVEMALLSRGRNVPDEAVVVRGGGNTPQHIASGSGVRIARGQVHEVSVNAGAGSVDEVAAGIRHGQVGVTTAGDIRAAGGTIRSDPVPGNPLHCVVGGLTAETLSVLLTPTIKNPCK